MIRNTEIPKVWAKILDSGSLRNPVNDAKKLTSNAARTILSWIRSDFSHMLQKLTSQPSTDSSMTNSYQTQQRDAAKINIQSQPKHYVQYSRARITAQDSAFATLLSLQVDNK